MFEDPGVRGMQFLGCHSHEADTTLCDILITSAIETEENLERQTRPSSIVRQI